MQRQRLLEHRPQLYKSGSSIQKVIVRPGERNRFNQIVSEAVAQAADGIARVSQCDVDYELVFVTQGHEEIRDRVKLGVVPFFTGAPEVLQLNQASLAFPQKHQAAMSRYVALHQELDFARLHRAMNGAVASIPRLRDHVSTPIGGLTAPQWLPDAEFELDYHVRHLGLPRAATMRQLLEQSQRSYYS